MKLGKGITVIAACAVLYASPGLASAGDPYPLSPPVIKKLFVGRKVYTFSESFYRPAVVRKLPAKRLADPFSSPENVLLAYLSALVTRDTAWFVSLAEQSEQEKARRRPKQSKEEMAVAFGQADDFLKNGTVALLRKETVGSNYAIIEVEVRDTNGEAVMTLPFSLIREGGKWRDCQSCNATATAPLYDLLLNFNYDFKGAEKHLP